MSRFDWDPVKNRENRRKHDVSFETAATAFEDQWILSRKDFLTITRRNAITHWERSLLAWFCSSFIPIGI
jgi:uncharacterized DUF497 family protein